MPYYVFRLQPFAQPELLAEFAAFAQASAHAKSMRAATAPAPGIAIKVMFADTAQQGQDLLLQVRERGPSGDD